MSAAPTTVEPEPPKMGTGRRAVVITFAAIVVGAAVWGITSCNRDGDPAANGAGAVTADSRIVSEDELAGLPEEAGHEVYWAGSIPDTRLEYSIDGAGNVHLRYLTGGAEVGEPSQGFLNVGSYPFAGAYQATRQLAGGAGLVPVTEHGGVGFFDPSNPYSVIIAWPAQPDLQVEVYDPEKNRALEVIRSGDIVPVP